MYWFDYKNYFIDKTLQPPSAISYVYDILDYHADAVTSSDLYYLN